MHDAYDVVRTGTDARVLSAEDAAALYATDARARPLVQIVWSNGHYNVLPPPGRKQEHLWLVVRHLRDRVATVVAGDVLKLGRFRLKIKEVVLSQQDAKASRFLCPNDGDSDDCETVAPEPVEFEDGLEGGGVPSPPDGGVTLATTHRAPAATGVSKEGQCYGTAWDARVCRICLGEDGDDCDPTNPLVAPCDCRGSMRWVHLQCLRTWMAGRLNIRGDGVSFFWRSLECELCKVPYPTIVKVDEVSPPAVITKEDDDPPSFTSSEGPPEGGGVTVGHFAVPTMPNGSTKQTDLAAAAVAGGGLRSIELFEFPRPGIPYAILEPRGQETTKGLYVVSLSNSRVARLGRGHESDIRLSDISVSRLHSILRFQPPMAVKRATAATGSMVGSTGCVGPPTQGRFIIEDNRSKFGTLLELRRPFRLEPNTPAISIQVGRTVLTLLIKRRWRLRMPACIRDRSTDIYVVFRQPPHPYQCTGAAHDISSPDEEEDDEEDRSISPAPRAIVAPGEARQPASTTPGANSDGTCLQH